MFWRMVTAPFRLLYSLFQSAVMLTLLFIFLIVAPFLSYLTMPRYQHDANDKLNSDISREFMLMDFSNNQILGFSNDPDHAHLTQVPPDYDYKSVNAETHGTLPAQWGFFNLIGFYGDYVEWARGKGAPMYAAYAEAATTSDKLRAALTELRPNQRIVLPDAPKIGMAWHTDTYPDVLIFGVCPVRVCDQSDYRLQEGHELFEPTLSANQAAAIAQMQYTMSDEYWLKEAHANGITNRDYRVRIACHINRMLLTEKYTSDLRPSHLSVGLCGAFFFLVLCCVGIAVFHSRVASFAGSTPTVVPGTGAKPIRLTVTTPKEQRATDEDREQRQQDRINRRLKEERQKAASQNRERDSAPPISPPSTNTLAGHFATLGIPVDATDEQIKTAYRDLAMVWHPDRFGDSDTRLKQKAEEQFKTIQAAYTYLQEHNLRPAVVSDIEKATPQRNGQWAFIDEETIQMMRETTEEAKQINKDTREFLDRMKQRRH